MISAFGVDHGTELAKARQPKRGGARAEQIRATSMTHRGGEGYFQPSAEQVSAARARRAAQAAYKAGRPDRRVGAGKKLTLAAHVKPGIALKTAGAAGVGAGAFYVLDRRNKVAKADRKQATDTVLGAFGGAGATTATSYAGGQALKAALKERRAARGESPREAATWAAHKRKHGNRGPNAHKAYAKYPKTLPDWRLQRALALKNNPKVAAATLAVGTAAGAVYGAKKSKVAKAGRTAGVEAVRWGAGLTAMGGTAAGGTYASRHKTRQGAVERRNDSASREAAAAAGGALAGQGAYQGAGYAAKHRALSAERTLGRAQRDKRLKPAKKTHGAYTPKMERNYPKTIPGWKTHRVLGWSHRGKAGTAVGAAATAAGALAAARAARKEKK